MSEEEPNQELSTDQLKDVAGGVSGQVVNKSSYKSKNSNSKIKSPKTSLRIGIVMNGANDATRIKSISQTSIGSFDN